MSESDRQRELLDVESVAGHLLEPGSVFARWPSIATGCSPDPAGYDGGGPGAANDRDAPAVQGAAT